MNGVQVASLFGIIDLVDNLSPGLNNADRNLGSFAQRLGGIGDSIAGFGARMTALTAPINALIGAGVATASSFQDAMAEVSARTGIVGAELERISDFALQLGADTAFSAQQAADAFLQLLSSGQTAEEALATLPPVLDAAAASGEDLGMTADMVTNIMASFGLGVDSASEIVDALSRAAGASSADIGSLGDGFSNVGGMARQFGLSVNQTAAILAIFAENGIAGAEAGTQLRSMLNNMTRDVDEVTGMWSSLGVSLYDAQGSMRPLGDVMSDLTAVMADMTDQERIAVLQTLGGSFGQLGIAALTSGMSIEEMQARMSESAGAADIAATRLNTFSGRVDALRGSVETLMIKALTPLMEDTLTPLAEQATTIINRVTAWTEANPELTTQIAAMSLAVGGLFAVMIPVGHAISAIAFALSPIGLPLTAATLAIGALAAAFATDFGGMRTTVEAVVTDIQTKLSWLLFQLQQGTPQDALNFIVRSIEGMFSRAAEYPYDVAAEYLWIKVRGALQNAGISLPLIDVGGLVQNIETSLSGIEFSNVQGIFEQHFDAILNLIGVAATLVFGGPVGVVLGIGRLVMSAIETDFLGIGTFLQDSGIQASVEAAFNTLKAEVERIWNDIIGALNLGGEGGDSPFQGFINTLSGLWTQVQPSLQSLADWFTTSGLPAVQNFIDTVIVPAVNNFGSLLSGLWALVSPSLGTLLEWFQTSGLPIIQRFVDDAINNFITPFVNLLEGVWTRIQPGLQSVFDWFTGTGLPTIGTWLNDTLNNYVLPFINTIADIWHTISEAVGSVLDWFTNSGLPLIDSALETTKTQFIEPVINTLSGIWESIRPGVEAFRDQLNTVFTFVKDNIIQPVITAIEGIIGAVGTAITELNNLSSTWGGISSNANTVIQGVAAGQWDLGQVLGATWGAVMSEVGLRDSGGPGVAGQPYVITPKAGPEVFIPSTNGYFIPNFDKFMASAGGSNGRGSGVTVNGGVHINVPESALASPQAARAAGDEFGRAFMERVREAR